VNKSLHPTLFAEVNSILSGFHIKITEILGKQFVGMYVIGSLALGDFDPEHSDIDFVVVTDTDIGDDLFVKLHMMHSDFAASSSPWSARVEAVYATRNTLQANVPKSAQYPQIERGTALFKASLESGWVFQCYTLREYALVLSGPDPSMLIHPIDPQAMRLAIAEMAGEWLEQARNDPEWLDWVRQRIWQGFVVQTLCRMLYSLATGDVASKPVTARWVQRELGQPWTALIASSVAKQYEPGGILDRELDETIAFIQYTFENSQSDNAFPLSDSG
jgi:hypothetical protein